MYDDWQANIRVDDEEAELYILDTYGQTDYRTLWDHWIRENDGFVLMYAINELNSFQTVQDQYKQVLRNKEERFDVILVGNKQDLPDSTREVTRQMGEQLAEEWDVPFIEASAKTGHNVNEIFEMLVREMRLPRGQLPRAADTGCNCYCCEVL